MSELICILGESGTGKSTSIRTLNSKETIVINTVGKALPFKGWKANYTKFNGETGNYFASDITKDILNCMQFISDKRPEIKYLIIDDFVYTMTNEFMRRSAEKGYEKFVDIGKNAWSVFNKGKSLRDNLKVIILSHVETEERGFGEKPYYRMKTVGKLVSEKISPEGLFTVYLFTNVKVKENGQIEYTFVTNNDGNYPAKSPMNMFDNLYIQNDLKLICDKIDEYSK